MFLQGCENFNLVIYTCLNQNLLQYRNSELKQQHTIIRLSKSLEDI